jgi:DnaJ-class molecular chaperone
MIREEKCVTCDGTGHRWCRRCGGSGKGEFNPWVMPFVPQGKCERCKGSGRDPDPDPACKGTGLITVIEK